MRQGIQRLTRQGKRLIYHMSIQVPASTLWVYQERPGDTLAWGRVRVECGKVLLLVSHGGCYETPNIFRAVRTMIRVGRPEYVSFRVSEVTQ